MKVKDAIWEALLQLRQANFSKEILGWSFNGSDFKEIKSEDELKAKSNLALLLIKANCPDQFNAAHYNNIKINLNELLLYCNSNQIQPDLQLALQNYWPLSVLRHLSFNLPFVFIHSAISLDGYLATESGHSHWIGNQENLIHAHRLRALLDSVLVGGKTVINDSPRLNVRHVNGPNPIRLILSNKAHEFSGLQEVDNCKTILLRNKDYFYSNDNQVFDEVLYFDGKTKEERILDLLKKCKQLNINSILVEGGGSTLSHFIETKTANLIQFHIAPLLFGSGIKAVKLPKVNQVNESRRLKNMQFMPIGDSFMVNANLV